MPFLLARAKGHNPSGLCCAGHADIGCRDWCHAVRGGAPQGPLVRLDRHLVLAVQHPSAGPRRGLFSGRRMVLLDWRYINEVQVAKNKQTDGADRVSTCVVDVR